MNLVKLFTFVGLLLSTNLYAAIDIASEHIRLSVDSDNGDIQQAWLLNSRPNEAITQVVNEGDLFNLQWGEYSTVLESQQIIQGNSVESIFLLGDAIQVQRLLSFDEDGGNFEIEYNFQNLSNQAIIFSVASPLQVHIGEGFNAISNPENGFGDGLYSYLHPFMAEGNNTEIIDVETPEIFQNVNLESWSGWINRRFVLASMITQSSNGSGWQYTFAGSQNDSLLILQNSEISLNPGETFHLELNNLIVEKSRQSIQSLEPALNGLILINLWDWYRWICFGVWGLVDLLLALFSSWGVSLIFLAMLIRVAIYPITRLAQKFQTLATLQQQKIQPLLAEIKQNYKGIEASEKIVQLYKDQHYDQSLAFKSMLGLAVQILVFIAIFNLLGDETGLYNESFLWIQDLAAPDRLFPLGFTLPFLGNHFNLLPLLMALMSFASSYYSAMNSVEQKKSLFKPAMMALAFFILFYSFPAALVLYWFSANLFYFLQLIIENYLAKKA